MPRRVSRYATRLRGREGHRVSRSSRPDEPGELAGDRGDGLRPGIFPCRVSCRYLPCSRRWAFQDRAGVSPARPACRRRSVAPIAGPAPGRPGPLDQRGADRLRAGLADAARGGSARREYSEGASPVQPMNAAGRGEPAPVDDLGGQGQPGQLGDAAEQPSRATSRPADPRCAHSCPARPSITASSASRAAIAAALVPDRRRQRRLAEPTARSSHARCRRSVRYDPAERTHAACSTAPTPLHRRLRPSRSASPGRWSQSRTSSSARLGTRIAVSSPARCRQRQAHAVPAVVDPVLSAPPLSGSAPGAANSYRRPRPPRSAAGASPQPPGPAS